MSTTTTSTSTYTSLGASSPSAPTTTSSIVPASSSIATQTQSTSQPSSQIPQQKEQQEDLDIYDEIELEDMTYDPQLRIYHYPCPCGDRFEISVDDMRNEHNGKGNDVGVCPGCSLMIRVIFEVEDLEQS